MLSAGRVARTSVPGKISLPLWNEIPEDFQLPADQPRESGMLSDPECLDSLLNSVSTARVR